MREKILVPMDIQLFAEPGTEPPAPNQQTPQPAAQTQQQSQPQIDYDKIAQLIEGKQAATEESVIKGYLKQQGLTKEQMEQAITTFKQQQAANTPDVNALQTQAQQAQALAQQKEVENAAILKAIELGVDSKTVPYLLKMADLESVRGDDGKINEESLKNAINKVLEDIPALKPQAQQASGFQIGASGGNQQTTATDDALKKAFGL